MSFWPNSHYLYLAKHKSSKILFGQINFDNICIWPNTKVDENLFGQKLFDKCPIQISCANTKVHILRNAP